MSLTQEQFEQLKKQLMLAKNQLKPEDYQKVSSAVSQSVGKKSFLRNVYEGIAEPTLTMLARPGQLYEELRGREAPYGRIAGVDISPPPQGFADVKKDIGRGIQTVALGIPAGTIPKLAAMGGAFSLGASLEEGNPLFSKDTVIQTLLGAGMGAGMGIGTKLLGKGILKTAKALREPVARGVSRVLGYTSDVAPQIIEEAIINPKKFAAAQKEVIKLGNPKVLSNLQEGVRKLRTDLTQMWKVGQTKISDATPNLRVGLNEQQTKLFANLSDRFGIDLPQNLKSFSSKELLDLNAELNSLYSKKFVREGAEGLIIRKGKDILDALIDSNFKEVGMKDFLQGYGAQKTVLDAMNELFNAYKTKSPKAVSSAFRNIRAAFQDDKYAYIEALESFEKTTGIKIIDQLRAMQLQPLINKSGKFSMDEVFRMVLLPLTSPKLVGLEAKTIGRLINGAQSTGEFIANLSGLMEKVQKTKIPIENLKAGLSIEDISKKGFQGYPDLTTKFLDYAKGKTSLSKQEIIDFARRPELKKGEADLLNNLAKDLPEGKLPAQEFADSIRRDLLELTPVKVKSPEYTATTIGNRDEALRLSNEAQRLEKLGKFDEAEELTRRADELAYGGGKNYEEVVFESPITTNGSSHYPNSKNYFAHARGDEVVENGKKIWREQEIQADVLQKEGLEKLRGGYKNVDEFRKDYPDTRFGKFEEENIRNAEKLDPFTNDRFGERIMRERIREKAQAGYEKYRLPTGETIGKIEGFGDEGWTVNNQNPAVASDLKVGEEIWQTAGDMGATSEDGWIITDILDNGRFKAVPKRDLEITNDFELYKKAKEWGHYSDETAELNWDSIVKDDVFMKKLNESNYSETFDLTGKSNPQYRRYENWGKFLKNKFGGKLVTDAQGNTWIEVSLKKEMGEMPIEAFGVAPLLLTDKQQKK